MVEFTVAAKDFKKAINLILVGRAAHMETDVAEFRAVAGLLQLSSVGTETNFDADIVQAGYAQISIPVLKDLKKLAASYKQPRLRIRIEDHVVRIESYALRHPAIELKTNRCEDGRSAGGRRIPRHIGYGEAVFGRGDCGQRAGG